MEKKYILGIVFGLLVIGLAGFMGAGINKASLPVVNNLATSTETSSSTDIIPVGKPVIKNTEAAKPKVELFIMTYCPYGLQMQKAYLPVMELLGKVADIDIKFVDYAMHGEKELIENTRQYCIEKEQTVKYIAYAKCFSTSGQADPCLKSVAVDETKLAACTTNTDKVYKISELFNDKSTWLSGYYPQYPIYKDLNTKYNVEGSPTLVINGAQINVDRTPEAIKNAICATFINKPLECLTLLSSEAFQPGFGGDAGTTQAASCH